MAMQKRTIGSLDAKTGLDWEELRIFLAVARAGSARKAAVGLGAHYTSLTRRLATLEHRVGGRLFDKSVGGYALTPLGSSVMANVEAMETEALAVSRRLSGADQRIEGALRVTTTTTIAAYLVVNELKAFADSYPGIDLRVSTGYAFADLERGEAEVTIRASNEPGERLVGRRFGTYCESVYATPAYLTKHPPTLAGAGCLWMDWRSEESFRKRQRQSEFPLVERYMQIEDEVFMLEAAKAGMGMATMPCFYGDSVPNLTRVSQADPYPVLGIWLLTHPDLARNARVRCFLDYFAPILKTKEPLLAGVRSKPSLDASP